MTLKEVSIRVKRDVRHRTYVVSQCDVTLTAVLESGDDLEEVYKELHEDCLVIVEEMVEEEKDNYAKEKNEIKDQLKE